MAKGKGYHGQAESQKQARLFGIVAGGGQPKEGVHMDIAKAKDKLRGLKIKNLPQYAAKKK